MLIYVVFSTNDRQPLLGEMVRSDLHAYFAATVRNAGCERYRVGGVADPVRLAVRLPRTLTIAELVGPLKADSSKWLKTRGPELRAFEWQRRYGVFSVGPADLQALIRYIEGQEAHHVKQSFQDEFRAFLKRYGLDCDERYVWD